MRIAIGASGRQIMALVMREGVLWTGVGLGAGLVGARLLTRYLAVLLKNGHETIVFRTGNLASAVTSPASVDT